MSLPGWVHLNGNILAAVDIETTGLDPFWHEIIQIGIQPVSPFYFEMKPEHPERADKKATAVHQLDIEDLCIHAPDKWQVADWLEEWWSNLGLPHRKTLIPVVHNWKHEAGFLTAWLGVEAFNQFFYWAARDTMLTAIYLNDVAYNRGRPIPFTLVGLESLCNKFGIINENPHDALADARAEARVCKELLEFEV
jgi:DNA polymerase III epsilon subunit-like protein